MSKKLDESGAQPVMRAMTPENFAALSEKLREIYGDRADDLTVQEIQERHADLLAGLDGERTVKGVPVSDEGMKKLTGAIETGTAVRGLCKKLMSDFKGRKKTGVA